MLLAASALSEVLLLSFSGELLLPVLKAPVWTFVSRLMGVFACLVLALASSWASVVIENENLRNVVEPLRAFVFTSVPAWLCRRGLGVVAVLLPPLPPLPLLPLLPLLPGDAWDGCGAAEDVMAALGVAILVGNTAQESTDENDSLLYGCRWVSCRCFRSLASLDMALSGSRRRKERKRLGK